MQELKVESISFDGKEIPIALLGDADHNGTYYYIALNKSIWLYVDDEKRAMVLYQMIKDHIGEYIKFN